MSTTKRVHRPTRCFVRVAPPITQPGGVLSVRAAPDGKSLHVPTTYEAADGRRRLNLDLCLPTYDGTFDDAGRVADERVHDTVGAPLAELALEGKSAALLAYGQTGSGKSHNVWKVLLPRTAAALFDAGATSVRVAVVQLYRERLDDLLFSPPPASVANAASASSNLPHFAKALPWLPKVTASSSCASPNVFRWLFTAREKRPSASVCCPTLSNADPRFDSVVAVSGCPSPIVASCMLKAS